MKRLLPLALLLLPLAGCDSGSDDSLEPAQSAVGLDAGTEMVYRWSYFEFDEQDQPGLFDQATVTVRVVGTNATVGGLKDLTHVQVLQTEFGQTIDDIWYQETPTALLEVAYRTPLKIAASAPKRQAPRPATGLLPFTTTAADSVVVREEPRLVYALPLRTGRQWTAFREPFVQRREVVGSEAVTVPAGTFETTKIRTIWPESEGFDYLSADGVVLRELFYTITLRDEQNNEIGTRRQLFRMELMEQTR